MSACTLDPWFDTIAGLLKQRSGLSIGFDKIYLLETRLAAVLKRENLRDLSALAARLRRPGNDLLAAEIVEAMTTNETLFFRDHKPFAHLRGVELPRLLKARGVGETLRFWSAAASSGQEAYSMAMLLEELRGQIGERKIEIVGTDIAREPLKRAREGLYSQFEVQRGLPVQMLVKHFKKEGAGWRISAALREVVHFREWNLLSDLRPLGKFDVVFCRNVLIYFDQPTKARVLEAIAEQMAPDGVLFLGGAETVLGITDRFAPLREVQGAYYLRAGQVSGRRASIELPAGFHCAVVEDQEADDGRLISGRGDPRRRDRQGDGARGG